MLILREKSKFFTRRGRTRCVPQKASDSFGAQTFSVYDYRAFSFVSHSQLSLTGGIPTPSSQMPISWFYLFGHQLGPRIPPFLKVYPREKQQMIQGGGEELACAVTCPSCEALLTTSFFSVLHVQLLQMG